MLPRLGLPRGTGRAAPAGSEPATGARATLASPALGSSLSARPRYRWAHVREIKLRVGWDPSPSGLGLQELSRDNRSMAAMPENQDNSPAPLFDPP